MLLAVISLAACNNNNEQTEAIKAELMAFEADMAGLNDGVKSVELSITSLTDQLNSLSPLIEAMESKIKKDADRADFIQMKTNELEAGKLLEYVKTEFEDVQTDADALKNDFKAFREKFETKKMSNDEATAQLASAGDEIVELNYRIQHIISKNTQADSLLKETAKLLIKNP